eukprot:TRINITY_DN4986_c0_g2_i1.p2 TRINITY_DN4986_c0_g2~~TRINITY_DN4986_c0_g2_i1.p2  ORF type:complete len:257 (-),score=26.50 TRINITY_DN4986_c0_g2_i1:226-996(-)
MLNCAVNFRSNSLQLRPKQPVLKISRVNSVQISILNPKITNQKSPSNNLIRFSIQDDQLFVPVIQNKIQGSDAEIFLMGEGLETPVQLLYLLALLGFLVVGAYLVVRQVLIRRELEEASKVLGERIRSNKADCGDFFELGVILLRKKLFTQATKNLEKAKSIWDGKEQDLAQLHNALGFAYMNLERMDESIDQFQKAVELQPGYVICWNNLGDAYEKMQEWQKALDAYETVLKLAPENTVAQSRARTLQSKLSRIS